MDRRGHSKGEYRYHTRQFGNESEEITVGAEEGRYIDRPLICYPDMFGTKVTCCEADETGSTAQFKDGLIFEGKGTLLEEI